MITFNMFLFLKILVVTVTLFNILYVTYSVYISFIWLIHLIFVVIVTVCNCFDKNVLSFMFLLYLAFYRTSCWNAMFCRIYMHQKTSHIISRQGTYAFQSMQQILVACWQLFVVSYPFLWALHKGYCSCVEGFIKLSPINILP